MSPDAAALGAAQTELARRHQRHAAALENAGEDCRLLDGTRIEVFANLGAVGEAERAVANGAEGCGLLRTEFLFLERDTAPDEDEQAAQYQAIADGLGGRPLIVRTLDAGGDKPMPYLPIPHEENPALGLRGVRVGLWRPQMLMTQLRAILRVAPAGQCKIMVPMVASPDELAAVRRMLEEARRDMGVATPVQLGVMIETPAAAVTADLIAEQADFLSIGTNDLTQYVLARDRGNPAVAADIDGLHPAVLRLIRQTCEAGQAKGRWVGVCGGLAGDMAAAPILVGLGVTELSAAPAVLPDLKALLRGLTMDVCRDLATRALACASVDEVRALADDSEGEPTDEGPARTPAASGPRPDAAHRGAARRRPAAQAGPAGPAGHRLHVCGGDAVFSNLGLLFAIGVAVGFARDGNGAAGLAGVVCFLIATEGAKALLVVPPEVVAGLPETAVALAEAAWRDGALARLSVPIGIISGLIAGDFYNRFSTLKLPEYLAFFAGRRFVPIVSGVAGLALAAIIGFGFSGISGAMDGFSRAIVGSGEVGLFLYGVLNRLLIVTGLHHILNNIAWFVIGDYQASPATCAGSSPETRGGRVHVRLLPGDDVRPACRVPGHVSRRETGAEKGRGRHAHVAGPDGVPDRGDRAHRVHFHVPGPGAVRRAHGADRRGHGDHEPAGREAGLRLFGGAVRLCAELQPVHAAADADPGGAGLFRALLRPVPAGDPLDGPEDAGARGRTDGGVRRRADHHVRRTRRGLSGGAGRGGQCGERGRLHHRLRLILNDQSAVDEAGLKALGARGLVRPSDRALQVVLGPIADQVADEIRAALTAAPVAGAGNADDWLAALGGRSNVLSVERRDGRVLLRLKAVSGLDVAALKALGARGWR